MPEMILKTGMPDECECECDVLSVLRSLGLNEMAHGGIYVIGGEDVRWFSSIVPLCLSGPEPVERTRRRIKLLVIIFGGSLS